jgi:hypothetical protein
MRVLFDVSVGAAILVLIVAVLWYAFALITQRRVDRPLQVAGIAFAIGLVSFFGGERPPDWPGLYFRPGSSATTTPVPPPKAAPLPTMALTSNEAIGAVQAYLEQTKASSSGSASCLFALRIRPGTWEARPSPNDFSWEVTYTWRYTGRETYNGPETVFSETRRWIYYERTKVTVSADRTPCSIDNPKERP